MHNSLKVRPGAKHKRKLLFVSMRFTKNIQVSHFLVVLVFELHTRVIGFFAIEASNLVPLWGDACDVTGANPLHYSTSVTGGSP